jgi:hypothetical protein
LTIKLKFKITELENSLNQVVISISLIGKQFIQYINFLNLEKFMFILILKYDFRFIQNLDIVFPDVKRVLIEKKEEELFKQIMARKGQVKLNFFY